MRRFTHGGPIARAVQDRVMATPLRALARRLAGVRRIPTYYLPWLTRPGLGCTLLLNNIQARFRPDAGKGPFPLVVTQYDADGALVRRYEAVVADGTARAEVHLEPTPAGCGFATVQGEHLRSGLYVALSDGESYTATHGRGEFVERYPLRTRVAAAVVGGVLALLGRTIPVFRRGQFVYAAAEHRSHLLLMNLANVTNRIRVTLDGHGPRWRPRLVSIPPMGAHLLDVSRQVAAGPTTEVRRVTLEGNAWFNLYVVGAGPRDLDGPLSVMHVK
jgi:hypothetical protein